jgi:hypothetical protein
MFYKPVGLAPDLVNDSRRALQRGDLNFDVDKTLVPATIPQRNGPGAPNLYDTYRFFANLSVRTFRETNYLTNFYSGSQNPSPVVATVPWTTDLLGNPIMDFARLDELLGRPRHGDRIEYKRMNQFGNFQSRATKIDFCPWTLTLQDRGPGLLQDDIPFPPITPPKLHIFNNLPSFGERAMSAEEVRQFTDPRELWTSDDRLITDVRWLMFDKNLQDVIVVEEWDAPQSQAPFRNGRGVFDLPGGSTVGRGRINNPLETLIREAVEELLGEYDASFEQTWTRFYSRIYLNIEIKGFYMVGRTLVAVAEITNGAGMFDNLDGRDRFAEIVFDPEIRLVDYIQFNQLSDPLIGVVPGSRILSNKCSEVLTPFLYLLNKL